MVVKGNAMTNNDDEGIDAGDIDAVSISERGHDGAAGSTPATVPNRNPIRAGIDAMEKQAMHTLDPWEGINAPHTQTSTGEELSLRSKHAPRSEFPGNSGVSGAIVAAPDDLGDDGCALWENVTAQFILRVDEFPLLAEMCRTVEMLRILRSALTASGTVTSLGSRNQETAHPLLAEIRGFQASLLRIQSQLGLPDAEDHAGATPAARKSKRAANIRWMREFHRDGEATDHGDA